MSMASTMKIGSATLAPSKRTALRVAYRLPAWTPRLTCAARTPARHIKPVISAKLGKTVKQAAATADDVDKTKAERIQGLIQLGGAAVVTCLGLATGGVLINDFSSVMCNTLPEGCKQIPLFMLVPLVATHLLTFCLIPATMYVFYTRSQALKGVGAQNPFTAMVGLSYIMAAIAGEIGWHVTQEWFYAEDYSILNFTFYFFLILGTSLWAIGIKEDDTTTSKDEIVDYALLACPVLAGVIYLLGAAVTHTKVPIYILLSFQYAILTYRFRKLLDTPLVYLFPFFSVGVNLAFIAALNANQTDPILNPLFHILHDAAGTEAGVAVIATLIYLRLPPNAEGPKLM